MDASPHSAGREAPSRYVTGPPGLPREERRRDRRTRDKILKKILVRDSKSAPSPAGQAGSVLVERVAVGRRDRLARVDLGADVCPLGRGRAEVVGQVPVLDGVGQDVGAARLQ